jgi:hypothetical protein
MSVPAFERGAVPNANATTAIVITRSLFPIIDIPRVVWPIEPNNRGEVSEEIGASMIPMVQSRIYRSWRVIRLAPQA